MPPELNNLPEDNNLDDLILESSEGIKRGVEDTNTLLENNIEATLKTSKAVDDLKPTLEKIAENTKEKPVTEAGEHTVQVIKIKGEKGEKGDKGDKGDKGEPGKDGKDGKDGRDGIDGIDGVDGKDGRDGIDGKDGKDGIDGKDGAPGERGEPGKDGSPDTAEEIVLKINSGDAQIDASKIKGAFRNKQASKTTSLSELDDVDLSGLSRNAQGLFVLGSGGVADNITGLIEAGTNVTLDGSGTSADPYVVNATGGGGAVDSVNGQTGVVVLDADDIDDTSTAHKFVTATDITKLSNLSGTNTGDQTSIVGITGTKAQFDTAVTDGNFLYVGDITQYTDEMAQDAVGGMVANSTFVDLAYVDGTPSLTASLSATGTPSASTFLRGDNTWATPAGSGDVSKVGTPSDNQMAVWTGDGTLEGTSDFTYDGTNLNLITGKNFQIAGATVLADAAGTTTLSNIDAIDATTETTIEGAIDTLANLSSVAGTSGTIAFNAANITDLGDVTFKTGVNGGTLRTGTSAADKFVLQAYDVNDTTYRTVIELDAGNVPVLQLRANYLEIDDDTDTTKRVLWDVSGATAGTATTLDFNQSAARTITFPNATGTLALTSDITGTNSGTNTGDQTITNSSDATSHTVTLSASGGSLQIIEGSNITLTTGGTGSAGTLTIAASGGGGTTNAYAETPAGLVNSSNTVYTLANTPADADGVIVILDGVVQYNGVDYTVTDDTITFSTAPATGSTIFAYYNTFTATTSTISRTVVVTSGSVTMGSSANVDYVYFVAGAHTLSLPAAAGNTNRYTVKNNHSANITIDTVGAENIEGASSISIAPDSAVDIISDGTDWYVV